jgi:hypothetical protein
MKEQIYNMQEQIYATYEQIYNNAIFQNKSIT